MTRLDQAAVLAAASAALGDGLTGAAGLGGSKRSEVLRCRASAGSTVVVKSYPQDDEGAEGFTAEAAGLEFAWLASAGRASAGLESAGPQSAGPESAGSAPAGGLEVAPRLLAADRDARVIVMSDLGDAPSLADVLLGTDRERARAALLAWTRACGELAVRTAGREPDLARLAAAHRPPATGPASADSTGGDRHGGDQHGGDRHGGDRHGAPQDGAPHDGGHWLRRRLAQIPGLLDELALPCPPGLAGELAEVWDAVAPGRHDVFSPGDICPDNNLLTPAGVRFIDFESAEFHSVFLDAAYLRMPFSSCWCVFRLPAGLARDAEAGYRRRISGIFPELAGGDAWDRGVRAAQAAWTLHAMTYLLDRSVVADGPMIDDGRQAPTARQLLRYRWLRLRAELATAGQFPAIAALAAGLLAATERWQAPDLPRYPALRRRGPD